MPLYTDPIHKTLKLIESIKSNRILESDSNNPGNLLIGQLLGIRVIDASGNSTVRAMRVGEFYPAGEVLLKDVKNQDTVVLQFEQDQNKVNGLLYTGSRNGVQYELIIADSQGNNLLSNMDFLHAKDK